jgi:hypothetical protein
VRKHQVFLYLNVLIAGAATIVLIGSLVAGEWTSALLGAVFLVLALNGLRSTNRRPRGEEEAKQGRPGSWMRSSSMCTS